MKLLKIIGLAGVNEPDNEIANMWDRYFNIMLIAALIWMLFQWHLEYKQAITMTDRWTGNFIIWLFFVIESATLLFLVNNKKQFIIDNYMNFIIILVGLPLLFIEAGSLLSFFRLLRLLFIIALFIPWLSLAIHFLTDNRLDTTVFTVVIILLTASVIIVDIDPNINSISDGVWWAWVTISTVGYGDIVPTSTLGRIFAAFLIFIGMGLFSIITANFAAIFIQRKNAPIEEQHFKQHNRHLKQIKKEEDEIIDKLNEILKRLEKLEKNK